MIEFHPLVQNFQATVVWLRLKEKPNSEIAGLVTGLIIRTLLNYSL